MPEIFRKRRESPDTSEEQGRTPVAEEKMGKSVVGRIVRLARRQENRPDSEEEDWGQAYLSGRPQRKTREEYRKEGERGGRTPGEACLNLLYQEFASRVHGHIPRDSTSDEWRTYADFEPRENAVPGAPPWRIETRKSRGDGFDYTADIFVGDPSEGNGFSLHSTFGENKRVESKAVWMRGGERTDEKLTENEVLLLDERYNDLRQVSGLPTLRS